MRPKTRPITGPFALQKQKTKTCATLLPTCNTSHRNRPAMRPKTRPITSRRSRPGTRQTGAQLHPKVRQRKQKAFAFATLSKVSTSSRAN